MRILLHYFGALNLKDKEVEVQERGKIGERGMDPLKERELLLMHVLLIHPM
jgi:hypothetical protein